MQEFPGTVQPAAGNEPRRIFLTIAGFDPSSGAGLTADLKVFAAHSAYGVSCPTAWTIQSTQGVRGVTPADAAQVRATLACLAADMQLEGIKIGMLATAAIVDAVAEWIAPWRAQHPAVPIVLDPVMRASSGAALLEPAALPLLREALLPLVSVITPNLSEAAELAGVAVQDRRAAETAAHRLRAHMGPAALGVIVTGGHLVGTGPDDLVVTADGASRWIAGDRVDTHSTHGTGCAYSSSLVAHLAAGRSLPDAAAAAKQYVEQALRAAYPVGRGRGPMHHLFACDRESRR